MKKNRKRQTSPLESQILALYNENNNISGQEIALKLDTTWSGVNRVLKRNNIFITFLSKKTEQNIINDYNSGMFFDNIGPKYNLSRSYIEKILKWNEVPKLRRLNHLPDNYDPTKSPTHKKCCCCKQDKLLEEFTKSEKEAFGVTCNCRECQNKKAGVRQRHRYKTDPEYKKKSLECSKRSKKRDWYKKFSAERLARPEIRIINSLRTRIRTALLGAEKSKDLRTEEYIGISFEGFREYIKSTWKPGMTWENYGIGGWHIDHIIPCAAFNLLDPDQQKKCFHYTNMQALWESENISKGCKLPDGQDARRVFGENTFKVPEELSIIK